MKKNNRNEENNNNNKSKYKPIVPAVEQALKILLYLGRSTKNKQTLTEICDRIGIHKSKVFSILNTLKQFDFIEKDDSTKTYSVGPGLVISARNFLVNRDQKEIVGPYLKKLAEKNSSTALLCQISDDRVYVAAKHEGNQDFGFTVRRGFTFHITHGAHGKAIVAFMPRAEKEKILSGGKLYFYSKEGAVDMKRLEKDLAECRKKGYAHDSGELHPGINLISAPLFGPVEKMFGCILLIGNFPKEQIEKIGYDVSKYAKKISHKLGADISQVYENEQE